MKRLFSFVVSVMLSVAALTSARAQSRFHLSADLARYRGDSTSVYLELYYSFDVSQLTFQLSGTKWKSEVLMQVAFKRSSDDSIVAQQMWRIPISTTDSSLLSSSRTYVDVAGFFLKPDIYRLSVSARDMDMPAERDSFSMPIDLQPIAQNQISLSDVELCTSIVPADKDSVNRFVKNTYEVKPNPSRIYGAGLPVVFYYVEAYGLLKNSSPHYYTKVTVTNSIGTEVLSRERMASRVNESNVEVGTVKVNTLRTGSYNFNFTIIDSVDNSSSTSTKRFFVYNPTLPMDSLTTTTEGSIMGSEYGVMAEPELDREIAEVRYIAKDAELAQFKSVTGVDAKRKLLYEFWRRRENDPDAPKKSEYLKRVDYTNEHFRNAFQEGWKTDRGRVFIVYGPPDEIDRHASEGDTKPYEIWTYNSIQGGVEFVFGDRSGSSNYTLLHSTDRNEIHDDNWMQELQTQ